MRVREGWLTRSDLKGCNVPKGKKWDGDGEYWLPVGSVYPYRLWFEFLSAACADQSITVNREHYAAWGCFEQQKFDDWWRKNWRDLFGVRSEKVTEVHGDIKPDGKTLILSLPRSGSTEALIKQVRKILDKRETWKVSASLEQGRFGLKDGYRKGFLNNLDRTRRYLRVYKFWLDHSDKDDQGRLDAAAFDYLEWGRRRRAQLAKQDWTKPRPYIDIPPCYEVYVGWLKARKSGRRRQSGELTQLDYDAGNVSDARRQIKRDIRRARNIASAAARGVFPDNSKR